MAKATKVKQLSFSLPNRPNLLNEVTSAIANAKVNITAICVNEMGETAYFVMNVDSNAKAKKALPGIGADVKEEDLVVLEMPNKVGELEKVAEAGINIEYVYGTTSTGKTSACIFKTADNRKSIRVINK